MHGQTHTHLSHEMFICLDDIIIMIIVMMIINNNYRLTNYLNKSFVLSKHLNI